MKRERYRERERVIERETERRQWRNAEEDRGERQRGEQLLGQGREPVRQ
jgi:hypothetical protein